MDDIKSWAGLWRVDKDGHVHYVDKIIGSIKKLKYSYRAVKVYTGETKLCKSKAEALMFLIPRQS